ncbi:phosphotransferase [Ramlibacter tataouinensis]|uniref:Aminoglycoside phosphotransferase domain-containing protein n=1 Tax=Ramlibacter tataouinensis (strain ATCC BAA-407 / DSM 14655 / LMG 21543 / TTB310) TaxID=365046 RepID=F5XYY0_RAMTT|nr:phosphotransferase [Ramlibacter tataouinensis]AEG91968.1 Hypothetical protein Rta_08860 [Ramlibacter tataouinensis TTB310]
MLLIISGQYVESELRAEFGKIPPTFLPLGNQRLYTHQIAQVSRSYGSVVLTLPSDFHLEDADGNAMARLGVRVIRTAVGQTLGGAVQEALGQVDASDRIDILYGDTLVFEDELGGTDWIAVGNSDEFYPWHYEASPEDAENEEAWAGMFSFSNADALRRLLRESGDFIQTVTRYGREYKSLERRSLKRWLDFGHVHTYFHSRLAMTTQRHFNRLNVVEGVLTKSSDDVRKMCAEATWFETAPQAIRPFLPNLICGESAEHGAYSIEYLPLTSLSELYVFGRLPVKVWKKVMAACNRYLCAERGVPVAGAGDSELTRRTYLDKTLVRLEAFSRQTGVDIHKAWQFNGSALPSLSEMTQQAYAAVSARPPVPSFVHGDLCFSNILYDFRADRIKVIDPRGLDASGRITSFGDFRYDMAKLAHSVLGLYDAIVAGRFELMVDDHDVRFDVSCQSWESVQRAFKGTSFAGRTPDAWDCEPIMVLLFLSMLPLHADQPRRQTALMANCMRIFQEWRA